MKLLQKLLLYLKQGFLSGGINYSVKIFFLVLAWGALQTTIAQTNFANLGNSDSGGSGYKTVQNNSIIVVSNQMTNDGTAMFAGNNSSHTILAYGVDDFTFENMSFTSYGNNTADDGSSITFKDKNGATIQTMTLSANKWIGNGTTTTFTSFFDNGTATPIANVAEIILDFYTSTGQHNNWNYETITTSESSLPVELSSFTAQQINQNVEIKWATESETDNLGFILEKSTDNVVWKTIASYKTHVDLQGQGSTSNRTEYAFIDKTVEVEADYTYRLSEVSIEGERNVIASTSVHIDALPMITQLFAAYPNPFNPTTTVAYQLAKEERVEISVYNTLGSFIKTLYSSNQPAGSYQVNWNGTDENGSKVPSGAYLIRMQTDKVTQTHKVLLVK